MGKTGIASFKIGMAILLLLAGSACDETTTVVANPDNEPPTIVRQGDVPTGPLQVLGWGGPELWVLVGDPNGLQDISGVVLDVDHVRIHELILRPATTTNGGCVSAVYSPGDVVDTSSSLALPLDLPGARHESLTHESGGIYHVVGYARPTLAGAIDVFGIPFGCGTGPPDWLEWLKLLPPAAESPTDVMLTRLDAEFFGVTVTVYDSSGASAKATFPDLRIVFTTQEEIDTPP